MFKKLLKWLISFFKPEYQPLVTQPEESFVINEAPKRTGICSTARYYGKTFGIVDKRSIGKRL